MNVPFNIPPVVGNECDYISKVLIDAKLCGDGSYSRKCSNWLQENFNCERALLTTSCTHALEMCALLADLKEEDEVIMPSYTFVSTANAFTLRGAKIVFVDMRPDTMNIDENLIEDAITERTKAIVPVHYAGVGCEMGTILEIARKYGLIVIEDAAQAVMSTYKNKSLGTIGQLGCYSFHETKNYTCGEGGALIVNDESYVDRAEIIREKGTDRSKFLRGQVDKYSWVDIGSSYLPSELNAAYLFAQLEMAHEINKDRLRIWKIYFENLQPLAAVGVIELPFIPEDCEHNAHMFYVKVKDLEERTDLMQFLKEYGVSSAFHYIPLHNSKAGLKFGRFHGVDRYTTMESNRLLRLPMYWGLKDADVAYITQLICRYYGMNS